MQNSDCGCCGKCCEAIWLGYSKEGLIERYGADHYDVKFVIENWEEITVEEFKEINPFYHKQSDRIYPDKYFYKCNAFDKVTRRCSKQDIKPYVCSGYPLYKDNLDNKVINGDRKLHPNYTFYSDKCVFKKALATEKEWMKIPDLELMK